MFTPGRITFVGAFMLVYVAYLVWAYYKDSRAQRNYYKGTGLILLILVTIWLFLYGVIRLLANES